MTQALRRHRPRRSHRRAHRGGAPRAPRLHRARRRPGRAPADVRARANGRSAGAPSPCSRRRRPRGGASSSSSRSRRPGSAGSSPASPMMQVLAPGQRARRAARHGALRPRDRARVPRAAPRRRRALRRARARQRRRRRGLRARRGVAPGHLLGAPRDRAATPRCSPHVRAEPDADLLVEFPARRTRSGRSSTARRASRPISLGLPPPFAVARLHGAWTRGLIALARGEEELEEFLRRAHPAHGGQCLLGERAASLDIRARRRRGRRPRRRRAPTGASFVVDRPRRRARSLRLVGGEGIRKRARREWPRITSSPRALRRLASWRATRASRSRSAPRRSCFRVARPRLVRAPRARADGDAPRPAPALSDRATPGEDAARRRGAAPERGAPSRSTGARGACSTP